MRNLVIKISEKPVISLDTGKTLGTLKGLIYDNNKVTALYCEFTDKYVHIPIKDVHIGSDAIMLKVTNDINMIYTGTLQKVYTVDGKEVGTVTSIEMDDFFNITGIIVDNLFIEIDKILNMENTIIVDIDKEETEDLSPTSDHSVVQTDLKNESDGKDDDEEQQTNFITDKLILESELASIQQLNDQHTENLEAVEELNEYPTEGTEAVESNDYPTRILETIEEIVDSEVNPKDEVDLTIEIDERYNHLCGKKLLEDITIVKETYEKGTLIDAALIQFAINNNAIVKVIMNTED